MRASARKLPISVTKPVKLNCILTLLLSMTGVLIHNHECLQFSTEAQLFNIHHLKEYEHTNIDLSTFLTTNQYAGLQDSEHTVEIHLQPKEWAIIMLSVMSYWYFIAQ